MFEGMMEQSQSMPSGSGGQLSGGERRLSYEEFLKQKAIISPVGTGLNVSDDEISPILKPHQRAVVKWAISLGRAGIFLAFGLGKTIIQLEIIRIILNHVGGRGLIILPLGVRQEFFHDAGMLGVQVSFIRRIGEAGAEGIYLTNYETIRDGKIDPLNFGVCSLDEAACLRGFGGTKTFREFMKLLAGDDHTGTYTDGVKYRFVATATPDPNEFIELLAYAAYLGVMDVSQAKTRFFKRDSTKADKLTIHPHKEKEFWLWVASWAIFLQKPSDLGYPDDGYEMPALNVVWHEVETDHATAGHEKNGQLRLLANASLGVSEAAREKRSSLEVRTEKVMDIVRGCDDPQKIIWCNLDAEQKAIGKAIKEEGQTISSLYGSQNIDARDQMMQAWKDKETAIFLSKPQMYGAGANLQQCHTEIFAGIGFKFFEFIQGIHRIYRFLQQHPCTIHCIYTEAERGIRKTLERKWAQHKETVANMTEIIRKYGLSAEALTKALVRKMGVERIEVTGEHYKLVNNDSVLELRGMESNSVGLVLTSIPFSTQYEYSPNFADFGHTNDNEHFWEQMEYLIPEIYRVLMPGRIAAIHVKDRIVPGGLTGLGFQTVYPFHKDCIDHFSICPACRNGKVADNKHGFCTHRFGYMGMKTIVTDVVRENNQTYRLGWTEQCKDGTKMGVGMPEYLLMFRKPPTDLSNSYADAPVTKEKPSSRNDKGEVVPWERNLPDIPGTGYSRSKWQIDAHGFTRSSGNRLLDPGEVKQLTHSQIFKIFRDYSLNEVYDFEHHVRIGEQIDEQGRLPVTFMLLQPQSWVPDVWTDITRMLTLNGAQSAKGREMHLCPMQFDLADRVIEQFSMRGETVLDPFGGLMTVPYRAIIQDRYGVGIELAPGYFLDGANYCAAAEQKRKMPTLFDLDGGDIG